MDFLYSIRILSFLYENDFAYLTQSQQIILEMICKYFKYYMELKRSPVLKSTVLLKFCQMIYLDPKFMMMLMQKLKIYEQILYEIQGNTNLYHDCDDKENFLLGNVGLFSLPENLYPQIIP